MTVSSPNLVPLRPPLPSPPEEDELPRAGVASDVEVAAGMPSVIVLLSLVGIVFLTIRLATDSGNWPTYGLGIAACIFVWARHAKVARSNRKIASAPFLHEIHDEATLGEALASKRVVLYKHSTSCPVSAIVIDEVLRFAEKHPRWPVHVVQIIEHRDLSDFVAKRLGCGTSLPRRWSSETGAASGTRHTTGSRRSG